MPVIRKKDALDYHDGGRPGKVGIVATKPCLTRNELALACGGGTIEICREIRDHPELVGRYTGKANRIAVVSNGTSVPGLGDVGGLASKPFLEGKAVLFKRFADIDAFDLELDAADPGEFVRVVKALESGFGGIDLEAIREPECCVIADKLTALLDVFVFQGEPLGTAIVAAAALLNAIELAGKEPGMARVVILGTGATGQACAEAFVSCGVRPENLHLTDVSGDALEGADVFLGVSGGQTVSQAMIASMARNPIVFALSTPQPEISPDEAKAARSDLILAFSDGPNAIDAAVGLPFLVRGALDVAARAIDEPMKRAAIRALAALAREDVTDSVARVQGGKHFRFGRECLLPRPFDPRLLPRVAPAVADAAMKSGAARRPIPDLDAYQAELERRTDPASVVMRRIFAMARAEPKRIVFPEGDNSTVIRAAQRLVDEKLAAPILIGRPERIETVRREEDVELNGVVIVDPVHSPLFEDFVTAYHELRQRRGVTEAIARLEMTNPTSFGLMMVNQGHADGVVAGVTTHYAEGMRRALRLVGPRKKGGKVFGVYVMLVKGEILFFADTTVNIDPSAEDLAQIALTTAAFVRTFDIVPRVAMLSFASFGASPSPQTEKVRRATELAREADPELIVEGEIQVDAATNPELSRAIYPFSHLEGRTNVFVFPSLEAANIGYKLLVRLGDALAIGPILLGMASAVNVIQHGADADAVVNLAAFTAVQAVKRG